MWLPLSRSRSSPVAISRPVRSRIPSPQESNSVKEAMSWAVTSAPPSLPRASTRVLSAGSRNGLLRFRTSSSALSVVPSPWISAHSSGSNATRPPRPPFRRCRRRPGRRCSPHRRRPCRLPGPVRGHLEAQGVHSGNGAVGSPPSTPQGIPPQSACGFGNTLPSTFRP